MKPIIKLVIGLLLLLGLAFFFGMYYLNNGSKTPDNTVWESYIGRDTTVGILPDQYANYFTYTAALTSKSTGFRIKGQFPKTRYFSFNVYSLGDNATQGSLVDYQIESDSGKPNPFLGDKDSVDVGTDFTVYIVPSNFNTNTLKNVLSYNDGSRLLTMVIRLYDYDIDDFGGVEFPTVEAFNLEEASDSLELKPINLPRSLNLRWIVRRRSLGGMVERLSHIYETENRVALDAPKSNNAHLTLPFHTIDTRGYIENNDNRYLLCGITKKKDEVYLFKFKAPSFTNGPEDINQTQVRYWSFNLGNAASYNFNALKDEDAQVDADGYVHIVLASSDSEIAAQANKLGYNFLEWNMPWKKGIILFRHMLANSNFEAQIDDVPPIQQEMTEFSSIEAQHYIGDFAPQGIRMSKEDFLSETDLW